MVPLPTQATDLVLHWRFDSPYAFGAIEPDCSGNSNDGLLVWARTRAAGGGEYAPGEGVFDGAGVVRGRGAFFSKAPLTLPDTWTLALWIKPADTIARCDTIITLTDPARKEALFSLGNRDQRFSYLSGGGDAKGAYALDRWQHIAIVCAADGTALYLDGTRISSGKTLPELAGRQVCLQLAGWRGRPHNRFTGLYDEVRLYDGPLDQASVAGLADPLAAPAVSAVADPGVGYTAWLEERKFLGFRRGKKATLQLDGAARFPVETNYRWDVVAQPDGAVAEFADASDPKTKLTVDKAGTYRLRLTAGSDSALVQAVLFEHDASPPGKQFEREPRSVLSIADVEPARPERIPQPAPIAPTAYWSFDDANAPGLALPETVAVSPTGKSGSALHVVPEKHKDAVLDFGVRPELASEFSLSFWINSDRTTQKAALFFARAPNGKEFWRVDNHHNSAKIPHYSTLSFGASSPIRLGQRWNHVVVAYSPRHDFRKLYINGHLVGTRKFSPLAKGAAGDPTLVFNNQSDNYSFEGLLDEVAIYDVTLNNEEVWTLYSEGVSALVERVPEDPYTSGAYRRSFVEKWFPALEPKPLVGKDFAEARFDAESLPPYTHPRLFFTFDDLPRLRAQCRTRAGNRMISQLRQYAEIANPCPNGAFKTEFSQPKAGAMLAEAYVTLLEADTENARRIIDWMMACVDWQHAEIAKYGDKLDDWQHSGHQIMLRYGFPLLYDWLYNWMSTDERAAARATIAACTQDRWSIGMYGHDAWASGLSNWQPWLTGELMLALQSIYREEGFDPVAYDAAVDATARCALLMADEASGASYEGMAKNNMQLEMYALLSRTQPRGSKLIGSQMPYNHVAKFLFHNMAPWGGEMMSDDALGGMAQTGESVSVNVMHYAYPDDPILNYMKHNTAGRRESYSSVHFNTFFQDSPPMTWSYVQDWTGPEDLAEHLQQAVAEADEPLGYFSNYRGLMISRSDWTPDALQLYFQPRCVTGGHPIPARGHFRLNALGREWVPFNGAYPFQSSEYHSVVTVDGLGQDNTVGKVFAYAGAARTKGASIDMMTGDMTLAYRQGVGFANNNEPRLEADAERPWMDLDKRFLVHWWRADRPGGNVTVDVADRKPKQAFNHAYRTAALVRGAHPYVVIVDDIKKDDQVREYNWGMMVPADIFKAQTYELHDDRAIFTDPDDPTKHLLVLPVAYEGEASFDIKDMYSEWRDKKGHVYKLNFRCRSAEPRFRMLLYPYADGAPLPVVESKDGRFAITIGEQVDELTVGRDTQGRQQMRMRRM